MAERAAVGHGPVSCFTDDGVRVLLPLREIYFDGNDVKTRTNQPASFLDWIRFLVARGRIVPGSAIPPVNAVALTAAAAGWNSNRVVVTVTVNSADDAKVDISVTETNTYDGLTVAALETILGSSAAGTKPGLLRFKPSGAPGPPPDPVKTKPDVPETKPTLENPPDLLPAWTIPGSTPNSVSFTLEARGSGSETGDMTIEVTEVTGATGAKKFTLNLSWTSAITAVTENDLTVPIADPASKLRRVAYAVLFSEPVAGGGYKLPLPGRFTLRGGADAAVAIPAKATLLAPNA